MQKIRYVNGNGVEIDLTGGNYGITAISGLSNANLNLQTQQVPNNDGSVYIDSLLDNRTIDMTLALNDGNDLEKRYQLRRELISVLNPKLGEGYLYYKNDYLERRIKVIPNPPVIKNKNSNEKGTVKASVSFTACGVYWEDVEETVVELKSFEEKTVVNNGDVPCAVKIEADTWFRPNFAIKNDNQNILLKNISDVAKIKINTNIGNKNCIGDSMHLKRVLGYTQFPSKIKYIPSLGKFFGTSGQYSSMISSDGSNWEFKKAAFSIFTDFIYVENYGMFFATCNSGYKIFYSSDFENWIEAEKDISGEWGLTSLAYSDDLNLFVAVGRYNNYISENGKYWTRTPSVVIENQICRYIKDLKLFIIIGSNGSIATSSDGITWTSRTSGTSERLNDVIYNNGNLYVVGNNGTILTSPDGITWTSRTSGTSEHLNAIIYNYDTELYVIRGSNGVEITSLTGIIWQTQEPSTSNEISSIAYSEDYGVFVCVSYYEIQSSINGIDWDTELSRGSEIFQNVVYSNGIELFVAVGNTGLIATSSDGITWTSRTSGVNSSLKWITYSEELNIFVAVGNNGTILTSPDGITWTSRASGTSEHLNKIRVVNSSDIKFIACGNTGTILTSPDGITWGVFTAPSTESVNDVMYIVTRGKFYCLTNYRIYSKNVDSDSWVEEIYMEWNGYCITYNESSDFIMVSGNNFVLINNYGSNWVYSIDLRNSGTSYQFDYCIYVKELDLYFLNKGSLGTVISRNGSFWVNVDSDSSAGDSVVYNSELSLFIGVRHGIISKSDYIFNKNINYKLSVNSDLNFNLQKGENTILIYNTIDNITARLTYRQKYLGV